MKNIDDFLIENGLSQTLLNNQKYLIDFNFVYNGQDLNSKMSIDGLELTGIDKTDAILIIDLLVKYFYIQWKEQYKYREKFATQEDVKYGAKILINDFEYSIIKHDGFGSMLDAKKTNTILIFNMWSLTYFIRDNVHLKDNQFLRKLIDFYDNLEVYFDMNLLYTPHKLFYNAITKFFDLQNTSIESNNSAVDEKAAAEIFNSFLENGRINNDNELRNFENNVQNTHSTKNETDKSSNLYDDETWENIQKSKIILKRFINQYNDYFFDFTQLVIEVCSIPSTLAYSIRNLDEKKPSDEIKLLKIVSDLANLYEYYVDLLSKIKNLDSFKKRNLNPRNVYTIKISIEESAKLVEIKGFNFLWKFEDNIRVTSHYLGVYIDYCTEQAKIQNESGNEVSELGYRNLIDFIGRREYRRNYAEAMILFISQNLSIYENHL